MFRLSATSGWWGTEGGLADTQGAALDFLSLAELARFFQHQTQRGQRCRNAQVLRAVGLALDRQGPLKQGTGARLGAEAPQHLGLLDQTQGQRRVLRPERPFLDGGGLFELGQSLVVAALLFVELGQILQAHGPAPDARPRARRG